MIWTPGGSQVVPSMWPNAEFNYSYSDRDRSYFMRWGEGRGRVVEMLYVPIENVVYCFSLVS